MAGGNGATQPKNKDRSNTVLISFTNVGSFGFNENSIVRKLVQERLGTITNKYMPIDTLMVQEVANYDVSLRPYFNKPATDNEFATYGKGLCGKRGVATYTLDGLGKVDLDDQVHEICVVIRSYKNKKGASVKFACLNIYRNQHSTYNRSSMATLAAINKIINKCKSMGIFHHVIAGDFNDESFVVPGYRNITSNKLYHQANALTSKKRIDKVFSNMTNVGILEIYNSCENVHGEPPPNQSLPDETDFGHKFVCLYVGNKPGRAPKTEIKLPSLKQLKAISKSDKIKVPECDPNVPVEDFEYTEFLAKTLTDKCSEMLELATQKIRVKSNSNNQVVLISSMEEQIAGGSKKDTPKDKLKGTYDFMERIKVGLDDGDTKDRPPLEENAEKLNKKLQNLNVMNRDIAFPAVKKLFPVDYTRRGARVVTNRQIRTIIMSVSNSGAKDYLKLSLKHTKVILKTNSSLRKLFHAIAERCLCGGFFPDIWKQDEISFLFKNKGSRMSADNYRPITISPSLGKHLEKYIIHYLSAMNDFNDDNHAYVAKHSCATAITDCQKKLLRTRNPLVEKDRTLGSKRRLITFISTDDIKSAFESIEHDLVCLAIKRSFAGDRECKVHELVRSYLNRRAVATHKGGSEKIGLVRKYDNKTAPQGSLLSPFLWRVYDSTFTDLYKDMLQIQVKERVYDIVCLEHVSYADDHVTLCTIEANLDEEEEDIVLKIRGTLLLCRQCLTDATRALGCGVNPDKSENIVPASWHEAFKKVDDDFEVKCTYKWLGYFLTLTNNGQLKFDVESMSQKFLILCRLRDDIFQYTVSIPLKLKIYKIYFAPFIELYAPLVIQGGLEKIGEVHRFQHDCLCKVLCVPFTICRKGLEEACGEPSVMFKAVRFAKRIQLCCGTLQAEQEATGKSSYEETTRQLRSGAKIAKATATIPSAKKHHIYLLNEFAEIEGLSDNKEKKKGFKEMKSWISMEKSKIQKRVRARLNAESI